MENRCLKKPSVLQKLRSGLLNKYTAIILATATLTACGSDEPEDIEPTNKAPKITLTNIVSNDDTNTLSGKVSYTDSDGTVVASSKKLQAETTTGERVTITPNADGTFSKTLTGSGKEFDALYSEATDNDGSTTKISKNLTPTITIEAAPVTSFSTETTVTTNPINEETSGKIATITNTVTKTVTVSGVDTDSPVTDANVTYTLISRGR